ncbi:calcium/sodium antiporter [Amphibiibacter pelophylacis]|uniref:Calcium/sodium antiporter n=1 Tax=Amphibiibacter pelophylacis TaxID=1799477 RepID=A0ACC6NYN2_9BURK
MIPAVIAVVVGLALLVWSADRFIDGAAATARHFSVPPLLVGIVIVGFGTSAPEMTVSALAALEGSPGLALGNAWGSNIANIALILGVTVLIAPIVVGPGIVRRELPILTGVTLLAGAQSLDGVLSRGDAAVLLGVFAAYMVWMVWDSRRQGVPLEADDAEGEPMSLSRALLWLVLGLVVLVGSSRLLVWGAVSIAQSLGVSDLVIGLTVVAVGTSLPELASCIAAARRQQHDIALGNVLGSNLFNTLLVVGVATGIAPFPLEPQTLVRDYPVMLGLTLALFPLCWAWRGRPGVIGRTAGILGVLAYAGYTVWLIAGAMR